MPNTHFTIMTSCASMPARYRGKYKNIAIVEYEGGKVPAMISERARGMVRIVRRWNCQYVGKSSNCEYARSMREAEDYLAALNAGLDG